MPIATPRLAAAFILRAADGRVLVSRRSVQAPFLGGFVAFVGGRIDDDDAGLARDLYGRDDPVSVRLATALRELLEETSLLLTDEGLVAGVPRDLALPEAYAGWRPPPLERAVPAGRWITPEYAPIRFDTYFLYVDVPAAVDPVPDRAELDWAEFRHPHAILAAHRRLDLLLPRPTRDQLETLAAESSGEVGLALAELARGDPWSTQPDAPAADVPSADGAPPHGFEPVGGIWQLPLRTPTLPPATHTNCYVVGHERAIVVDPATYEDGERAKLGAFLDALAKGGMTFEAVVLTHHHRDHVGSARWTADRLGVPVRAHPITRDLLRGEVEVDELLHEGDVIDLGVDADGEPFRLLCLHTPGHAAGHLVLVDTRRGERGMIVGDMVAAVGSIIVDPDEGDMAEYIRQLERLRARPDGVLYPAHGPPIAAGRAKLDAYIAHRLERERQVLTALEAQPGPATAEDLLPLAYADTPKFVWPLAERACRAHLDKLVAEGRALTAPGERFVRAG